MGFNDTNLFSFFAICIGLNDYFGIAVYFISFHLKGITIALSSYISRIPFQCTYIFIVDTGICAINAVT